MVYTVLQNSIILDTLFRDAGIDGIEFLTSVIQYDGEFATTFANQNSKELVNIYGLTFGFNNASLCRTKYCTTSISLNI